MNFNCSFFLLLGHSTPQPPPLTDPSNLPPIAPLIPSYQDSKPAAAWNDPPTVMMKVSKPSSLKVNSILLILF